MRFHSGDLASENGLLEQLLDLPRPDRLIADAASQSGSTTTFSHIELDRSREFWTLSDADSRRLIASYSGGIYRSPDSARATTLTGSLPSIALKMLFIEHLPLWGRSCDDWRPLAVDDYEPDALLITIEHRNDPELRGTVTIDRSLGIARSLVRPNGVTRIEAREW
ncbi:hypothetical protein M3147_11475 [Agromyces mediolanus]|uniref:hypothetical protein n=1 Tax=Agromyces mediolanus TaxID=41986 RepID=UPI00203E83A4|nr:hypothetical protein [Agromyces mediolanus]MCM3657872.1 hypothetical protein [Agromyces mediolanus]